MKLRKTRRGWRISGPLHRDAPVDDPASGTAGGEGGAGGTDPNAKPDDKPADESDPLKHPKVKEFLAQETRRILAEAEAKSRIKSKDNAKKEALAVLMEALGEKPDAVDPAELAKQVAAQRAENLQLKIDRALDVASRKLDADEELVGAVLARQGRLANLDPTAADFPDRVEKLVKDAIEANPRLKRETKPEVPAVGATGAVGTFNDPTKPRVANLGAAVAELYNRPR